MQTFPARTSRRGSGAAGFTLIELLLVLGLLSVMMLIALPAFQNLLQSSLQQEVNRFSGVLRLMRNEAVLTNTRYRLMIGLKENRYSVERQDDTGVYVKIDDPKQLAPHRFQPSLQMQHLLLLGHVYNTDEPEPVPVLVDSSGYVDPFLLQFTQNGSDYTLRVTGFTGRVSLVTGYAEP